MGPSGKHVLGGRHGGVDMVAGMEVDKVADMVAYMVVDMDGGRQKN